MTRHGVDGVKPVITSNCFPNLVFLLDVTCSYHQMVYCNTLGTTGKHTKLSGGDCNMRLNLTFKKLMLS